MLSKDNKYDEDDDKDDDPVVAVPLLLPPSSSCPTVVVKGGRASPVTKSRAKVLNPGLLLNNSINP